MKRRAVVLLLASMMLISQSTALVQAENQTDVPAQALAEGQSQEIQNQEAKADIFQVDFADGTPSDVSAGAHDLAQTYGSPRIEMSSELHKNIAKFDGESAYRYPFGQATYDKIGQNVTMECMVKFNEIPSSGEQEIFSNQQSGGIGLALENGQLTFFAHVGGSYRTPKADIRAGQWYHIAGVVEGNIVKLYVNGELKDTVEAPEAGINYTGNQTAWNMVLGGDSAPGNGVEYLVNADLSFAKLYSTALDDEQLKALSDQTFEGTDIEEPKPQDVYLGLVSSDGTAESGEWNLNLHVNGSEAGSVDRIEYDVVYDPAVLTYEEDQHTKAGVTVTKAEEGRLHIVSTASLSTAEFRDYGATRLAKLNFQTADVGASTSTQIKTENFKAFEGEEEVTGQMSAVPQASKELQIYAKNALDVNGDGVVGVGDVALAGDADLKEAAAQEAAIYPYKHVVILTVDGAGQVWNPDEIYYAQNNSVMPEKTSDPAIMAKRINTYAMDLINKEFATSYTAQSVSPSISAQNYSSILHGVPWLEVPSDYQVTNDSANQYYYADFGKEKAQYPSLFQAVDSAYPERQNAAFAEWTQILNGIIEPDAQVIGKGAASKQSFYDVAEYIRSDAFDNTAVVYMQSDWMDHVGHSTGYYNDTYWSELAQYDDYYKAVVDALEEKGAYDDTLIITNADHGGNATNHGSSDPSNMDIFIGVGGQTVNSGKRLEGGTNADISPLALAALRIEKPSSMTGKVFDESAFLSQSEMGQKNRDVEKISMERDGRKARITLSNEKVQTRAVDTVIDLKGAQVESIDAAGGTILRQAVEDGMLKLTISYPEQPEKIADITFSQLKDEQPEMKEIMLGTDTGDEIYPDLVNTQGDLGDDTENPGDTHNPDDIQNPDDDTHSPGGQQTDGEADKGNSGENPNGGKNERTKAARTGDGASAAGAAAGVVLAGTAALLAIRRKK